MTAAPLHDRVLDVENLSVDIATRHGTLHAVRRVSLHVKRGETLCIVGESGCGKSMTSLAIMGLLPKTARRTADRLAFMGGYGGTVDIDYQEGYPVLVNSAAETDFALQVAEELVGKACTIAPFGPVTGSEDFAYYLQHKPGCFFRLGNGEAAPMLHNANYDFDDNNLTFGAAYWTRLVENFLTVNTAMAP